MQVLPLDAIRAEFMGRQWGVPSEFLCYGKPFSYEETCALMLLHDVPVRAQAAAHLELLSAIRKAMDDFGRKEAEWLPYWRNADYVRVSPEGAYASLYRHSRNGVLAVVSNLGRQERTVTLHPNLPKLGFPPTTLVAHDALSQAPLQMDNGQLAVKLPSFGWKLIWIRATAK